MQKSENSDTLDGSSLEKREAPLDSSGDLYPLIPFVAYIVKNLVEKYDEVRVSGKFGDNNTIHLKLSVEKSDIGKVIGKKGKTIHAIRTILTSVASRVGMRVSLEILEEQLKDESGCENSCENSEGASRCEIKSELEADTDSESQIE